MERRLTLSTMTVKELIIILQTLPPDFTVVNEGYETGYEPIKNVTTINVVENKSQLITFRRQLFIEVCLGEKQALVNTYVFQGMKTDV